MRERPRIFDYALAKGRCRPYDRTRLNCGRALIKPYEL